MGTDRGIDIDSLTAVTANLRRFSQDTSLQHIRIAGACSAVGMRIPQGLLGVAGWAADSAGDLGWRIATIEAPTTWLPSGDSTLIAAFAETAVIPNDEREVAFATWLMAQQAVVMGFDHTKRSRPENLGQYFQSLSDAQLHILLQERHDVLGNLAGVPLEVRSGANHLNMLDEAASLRARAAELQDELSGPDGWDLFLFSNPALWPIKLRRDSDLRNDVNHLKSRADLLEEAVAQRRQIVFFDPSGDGRIAEWVGDFDAEHVAFYVPGTGSGLDGLFFSSARSIRMHHSGHLVLINQEKLAVVTSIVYDAPDSVLPDAAFRKYAKAGAPQLVDFVGGLGLSEATHVSVLAHSYGTLVVGHALKQGLAGTVDDVILAGSPGVDASHVSELGLPADHIFVARTNRDEIALASTEYLGREVLELLVDTQFGIDLGMDGQEHDQHFGVNPAHRDFGAVPVDTGDSTGHDGYFGDGPAFDNIVQILIGQAASR